MSETYVKGGTPDDLKERFKRWSVPVEDDFNVLITYACNDIKAGNGLQGSGASGAPVAVHLVENGGLHFESGTVALSMKSDHYDGIKYSVSGNTKTLALNVITASGLSDDNGLAVQVTPSGGLDKSANTLTLPVVTTQGLAQSGNQLVLNVDQTTLSITKNVVHVQCKPKGGLKVDENGFLTIDIATVLGLAAMPK